MALTQQDIDDTEAAINAIVAWANGGPDFTAITPNGRQVASPSKVIADSLLFKNAIAWPPGGTVTDATQTYTDSGIVYAPQPSQLPFIGSGAFIASRFYIVQGILSAALADQVTTGSQFIGYRDRTLEDTLDDTPMGFESISDASLSDLIGIDILKTTSNIGGWAGSTTPPKGSAIYYRDGATPSTPSTLFANRNGFFDSQGVSYALSTGQEWNVHMFGATGDGVTDDDVAVDFAVAASIVASRDLSFLEGTYLCSIEVTDGPIRITGAGPQKSILKNNSTSSNLVAFKRDPSPFLMEIRGFTLDNNSKVSSTLFCDVSNCVFKDLLILNYGNNTEIHWGFELSSATSSYVENISFGDIDTTFGGSIRVFESFETTIIGIQMGRSATDSTQYSAHFQVANGVSITSLYGEEGGGAGMVLFQSCLGLNVINLDMEVFSTRLTSGAYYFINACKGLKIEGGFLRYNSEISAPVITPRAFYTINNSEGVKISDQHWIRGVNTSVAMVTAGLNSKNIEISDITIRNVRFSLPTVDFTELAYNVTDMSGVEGLTLRNILSETAGATCQFDGCTEVTLENVPTPVPLGVNIMATQKGLNTAFSASSNAQSNVTGNATSYDVIFGNVIFDNAEDIGKHTGSDGASVLTNSGKSYTVNQLIGFTVTNISDGSSGTITANTATTVTATLAGGTDNDWDTDDISSIDFGNFDGISTFKAPVTGKYQLNTSVKMAGITDTTLQDGTLTFITSNRNYIIDRGDPFTQATKTTDTGIAGELTWGGGELVDLDAGDTVKVRLNIDGIGSADTVDIVADSYFSASLIK